jgi:endoglucanase
MTPAPPTSAPPTTAPPITAPPITAPPITAPPITAAPTHWLRTELAVNGMTCGHCVSHVRTALVEIPGVSAEVHLDAATATVTHPSTVAVQTLLDAAEEAGYEVAVHDTAPR